jgi:AcrR family transcriptional regulator
MGGRRATADERRAAVLKAALAEFAAKGLHGASTETIAAAAGISHPYLFKLFGTKRDLFLASFERVNDHIRAAFGTAAEATPAGEAPLWEMGKAYYELLGRRDELRLLLHGFAAAGDPELGPAVRERYADLYRFVQETSGADAAAMHAFWAHGMLLTIAAAIDLPALTGEEPWVGRLLEPPPIPGDA